MKCLYLTRRTFTRDVVTPGAVFCTLVYTVTAGQIVAEFTRHFTCVVVDFRFNCTHVTVYFSIGLLDRRTPDLCKQYC